MLLRPRQKVFVERSLTALDTHGNTLSVAPTGAGEASMRPLAAAIGNAIYDATGVRLRQAPFTPDRVRAGMA